MGQQAKLNRARKELEKEKIFQEHPTAKYIGEMQDEISSLHKDHPLIQMKYKNQITAIRDKYEESLTEIRNRKEEIIKGIMAKTEELLKTVDDDYRSKEIWSMMEHMEMELNELKELIKIEYGEEDGSNQDTMESTGENSD